MILFFFELKNKSVNLLNKYIIELINILNFLFKNQSNNGICVIKIDMLFHKPIIDIVYILTSMYEKIFIIKPNTSNIIECEKYIICKGFILNDNHKDVYEYYYNSFILLLENIKKLPDFHIKYIIKEDLPCFFMNKIDDINIIIGQQQLEAIDQIINIYKNKHNEIKIENIKKINIQKCIHWCEKYNIPCNKFMEKNNIFLNNVMKETENN